jgi:hypothetical protein
MYPPLTCSRKIGTTATNRNIESKQTKSGHQYFKVGNYVDALTKMYRGTVIRMTKNVVQE